VAVAVAVAATQAEAAIQDLVMTKRDRGGFITRYIYYMLPYLCLWAVGWQKSNSCCNEYVVVQY
jgi:hypothetical protein